MKTVLVEHDYAVQPAQLWAMSTDYGALEQVMEGLVSFNGLPAGRCATGDSFDVMVSLFGKLPWQPYHMDVLECDDANMVLRSSEKGAGVKSWRHTLRVTATPNGSRLSDSIEIDAGLLTPLIAKWAQFMYRARHKRRLKMLARLA